MIIRGLFAVSSIRCVINLLNSLPYTQFLFQFQFRLIKMKFIIFIAVLIITSACALEITGSYRITTWAYLPDHYQCFPITDIKVLEPKQFVDKINGQHMAGYSGSDIKSFAIQGQTVHYMPMGMTKFFPNLEALQIYECGLKAIDRLDLIEYKNLHSLYLNKNKITTLNAGLFDFTPKLWRIDFSYNRLRHVDPTIFDNIEKLQHADFNYNICTGAFGAQIGVDNVVYVMEKYLLEKCQNRPDATLDCKNKQQLYSMTERMNHISEFDLKKKLGIRD
ncbi:hypothetical protein ACKWTF_014543 [Chironomus riparius]